MKEKNTHKFPAEQIQFALEAYKESGIMPILIFMRKFKLSYNEAFQLYKKAFLIIWDVDLYDKEEDPEIHGK